MKRTLLILTALCACFVSCKKTDLDGIKSITLDVTESALKIGESQQLTATLLPETASDKPIKWTSSNPAVASVTNDGLVKAIAYGSVDITVKAKKGDASAICKVKVINHCPANAVDMGTDVYWAPCNLGATSQEQPGGYYAWDDIQPRESFSERKIITQDVRERTTEDLKIKPEYDAATVALGGTWRMPSYKDVQDLYGIITKSEKTINGQKGMLLHSNVTNNELFFPYGGYVSDKVRDKDKSAYLRVGEVHDDIAMPDAYYILAKYNEYYLEYDFYLAFEGIYYYGYIGYNIRPVCD